MAVLQDIISTYTDLSNPSLIYSDIVTKNIKTIINPNDIDIRRIEDTYGRTFVTNLLTAMDNIVIFIRANVDEVSATYLETQFERLVKGSGQNFSNDKVREQLDQFQSFQLLTPEVVADLKALAVVMESKWSQLTNDLEPTLEQVQIAVENEIAERQRLSWIAYVKNGILANNGNGKTIAELKALLNEYGG